MRKVITIVLRAPGLLIVETFYRSGATNFNVLYTTLNIRDVVGIDCEGLFYVFYYLVILFALLVIFLPIKKLIVLYLHLLIGSLLLGGYHKSTQYLLWIDSNDAPVLDVGEETATLLLCYGSQAAISVILGYLLDLSRLNRMIIILMCLIPACARAIGVSLTVLNWLHNYCTPAMALLFIHVPVKVLELLHTITSYFIRELPFAVQVYGWIPLLLAMCSKIVLHVQFLTFWCILFMIQLYNFVTVHDVSASTQGWLTVLLSLIGECCVSPMSLVGLSFTVSYVSYILLTAMKLFLIGAEAFSDHNVMHHGWMEGFTMFLLALQAEVTELQSPQREFLMSIILFIVISSLIHSMFEVADPFLLALGASHSTNIFKHIRAMAVCTFLWMMPLYMTIRIFQFFDLDFWLMVVVSNCILTSVQVIGCLAVYILFIFDAIQQKPWQDLDDVVYYVKAGTRIVEFIVALFVMCYGFSKSLFGEWSFVNSAILVLHCYFNVWQRLQVGWKTYLLRREAAHKIKLLPKASVNELQKNNDICPICIQEMDSACITPCNHFFHSSCLRKWLYIQEYCPFCHEKLILPKSDEQPSEDHSTVH